MKTMSDTDRVKGAMELASRATVLLFDADALVVGTLAISGADDGSSIERKAAWRAHDSLRDASFSVVGASRSLCFLDDAIRTAKGGESDE